MDRFVSVGHYSEPTMAHLDRTLLEAAGIPAFVHQDVIGDLKSAHLVVREADAEDAANVLADAREGLAAIDPAELARQALAATEEPDVPQAPTADSTVAAPGAVGEAFEDARIRSRSPKIEAARENAAAPACPFCGSSEVKRSGGDWLPLLCRDCGHRWGAPRS